MRRTGTKGSRCIGFHIASGQDYRLYCAVSTPRDRNYNMDGDESDVTVHNIVEEGDDINPDTCDVIEEDTSECSDNSNIDDDLDLDEHNLHII